MTDFRALCAELVELSAPSDSIAGLHERLQKLSELAIRARAALAEPVAPDPVAEFVAAQRPMNPEIAQVLHDNYWDLIGD